MVGRVLGHEVVQLGLAYAEAVDPAFEAVEVLLDLPGVLVLGRLVLAGHGRRLGTRTAAPVEVLLHSARQQLQPAVAEQSQDVVADALQEVAVVADENERARPAVEEVLQFGERLDVEVVGRLVEQQDVGLGHQQPQQLQAPPLAAGQVADRRPLRVAAEAEPLQHLPGRELLLAHREAPLDLLDRLQHATRGIELAELLGQMREAYGLAGPHASRDRAYGPLQQPQQSGLTAAVHPDDPDPVTGPELPGQMFEKPTVTDLDGDVLDVVHGLAEPRGREPHQLDAVARRRLVGDERVGGVDAELRLGRTRLRPAPQPGELLAEEVLPLLLGGGGDPGPLRLGEDVRGVAAFVPVNPPVGHLPRTVGDLVEEPAVVGDDDQRTALEMPGEPGDRLEVEMVGRLVEDQQVGLGHEQPGERDPPPLTTGHAVHGGVEGHVGKQPGQDVAGPSVTGPVVLGAVPEHELPNSRGRRELVPLSEIPEPKAPRMRHPALVVLGATGEHRDQRGLAVTVPPDDPDPVTGGHTERHTVEEGDRAVRLAEVFRIDQIHNAIKATGRAGYGEPTAGGDHRRTGRLVEYRGGQQTTSPYRRETLSTSVSR